MAPPPSWSQPWLASSTWLRAGQLSKPQWLLSLTSSTPDQLPPPWLACGPSLSQLHPQLPFPHHLGTGPASPLFTAGSIPMAGSTPNCPHHNQRGACQPIACGPSFQLAQSWLVQLRQASWLTSFYSSYRPGPNLPQLRPGLLDPNHVQIHTLYL